MIARSVIPVALVALGIATSKAVPADDLKSFIAWLKMNPDKATAATVGVGSAQQVGGLFFQNITGTRFGLVPYRGAAPAMQDVVAGHADWMMATTNDALPQVRAGSIKAYAVTAKTRLAAAPDIPTVDEAGLPGYYVSVWFALFAPKSTPKTVVAKLNDAVVDALADANARAVCRAWARDSTARPADTGGAGCASKGRNREMVADHQGGRHQGGVILYQSTQSLTRHARACRAGSILDSTG